MDLDDLERLLLLVVDDAGDAGVSTADAGGRINALDGPVTLWSPRQPWFGLAEAAGRLEELGLIHVESDAAAYTSGASPVTTEFWLTVTPAGHDTATGLRR